MTWALFNGRFKADRWAREQVAKKFRAVYTGVSRHRARNPYRTARVFRKTDRNSIHDLSRKSGQFQGTAH